MSAVAAPVLHRGSLFLCYEHVLHCPCGAGDYQQANIKMEIVDEGALPM